VCLSTPSDPVCVCVWGWLVSWLFLYMHLHLFLHVCEYNMLKKFKAICLEFNPLLAVVFSKQELVKFVTVCACVCVCACVLCVCV